MSDSELSDAPSNESPPDSQIEEALRKEVTRAAKGPVEEYTVSRIRKATEKILGLPEGFFKGDEKWKARSKTIIDEQVEVENESNLASEPEPDAIPAKKVETKPKKAAKRSSPIESSRPQKKQKLDSDEGTSALSSPPNDSESDFNGKGKKQKSTQNKKKPAPSKTTSKTKPKPKAGAGDAKKKPKHKTEDDSENAEDKDDGSESEMSVVLDEAPSTKKRSKSKATDAADKKSKASTTNQKGAAEADPDQEEIKKLQGWLAKCGIRKVWGKELKPYETSKAKMKYLRDMLSEIGMTGRYSNEKAAQIKEARELAADIEAVQEGNERWGKSDEEDGDRDAKTRGAKRLVRGAKNYDFLSSDGEETD